MTENQEKYFKVVRKEDDSKETNLGKNTFFNICSNTSYNQMNFKDQDLNSRYNIKDDSNINSQKNENENNNNNENYINQKRKISFTLHKEIPVRLQKKEFKKDQKKETLIFNSLNINKNTKISNEIKSRKGKNKIEVQSNSFILPKGILLLTTNSYIYPLIH